MLFNKYRDSRFGVCDMFIYKYNICNKENCCIFCFLLMVERYQLGLVVLMCFFIEVKYFFFFYVGVL